MAKTKYSTSEITKNNGNLVFLKVSFLVSVTVITVKLLAQNQIHLKTRRI